MIQALRQPRSRFGREWQQYETCSETLMALMVTGCYWGTSDQEQLWVQTLNRVSNALPSRGGYSVWDGLRLYPALLLQYCGGIAAIAREKYKALLRLLTGFNVRSENGDEKIAIQAIQTWTVLDRDIAKKMPDYLNRYAGMSDRLHKILRETLRPFMPDDIEYDRLFDRFEYIRSLLNFDLHHGGGMKAYGSPGRFVWRRHNRFDIFKEVQREIEQKGKGWPPLTAGLFNGNYDRFVQVKKAHDERMFSLDWY